MGATGQRSDADPGRSDAQLMSHQIYDPISSSAAHPYPTTGSSQPLYDVNTGATDGQGGQGANDSTLVGFTEMSFTYEPDLDLSINWLPTNNNISFDYKSILDLGLSANGLEPDFAMPNVSLAMSNPSIPTCDAQHNPSISEHRSWSGPDQVMASPARTVTSVAWSCSDSHSPATIEGERYATSRTGARIPCTIRSRISRPLIPGAHPQVTIMASADLGQESLQSLQFPNLDHPFPNGSPGLEQDRLLTERLYEEIRQNFERVCLACDGFFHPYGTQDFPSMTHLDLFVRLFLTYFHPIVPVVHKTELNTSGNWLLILAMATIGCQYTRTQEFGAVVAPMHEFLRRALQGELERGINHTESQHVAQSLLFSQIGMIYHGSGSLKALAMDRWSVLANLIKALDSNTAGSYTQTYSQLQNTIRSAHPSDLDKHWQAWVKRETRSRLAYMAWVSYTKA